MIEVAMSSIFGFIALCSGLVAIVAPGSSPSSVRATITQPSAAAGGETGADNVANGTQQPPRTTPAPPLATPAASRTSHHVRAPVTNKVDMSTSESGATKVTPEPIPSTVQAHVPKAHKPGRISDRISMWEGKSNSQSATRPPRPAPEKIKASAMNGQHKISDKQGGIKTPPCSINTITTPKDKQAPSCEMSSNTKTVELKNLAEQTTEKSSPNSRRTGPVSSKVDSTVQQKTSSALLSSTVTAKSLVEGAQTKATNYTKTTPACFLPTGYTKATPHLCLRILEGQRYSWYKPPSEKTMTEFLANLAQEKKLNAPRWVKPCNNGYLMARHDSIDDTLDWLDLLNAEPQYYPDGGALDVCVPTYSLAQALHTHVEGTPIQPVLYTVRQHKTGRDKKYKAFISSLSTTTLINTQQQKTGSNSDNKNLPSAVDTTKTIKETLNPPTESPIAASENTSTHTPPAARYGSLPIVIPGAVQTDDLGRLWASQADANTPTPTNTPAHTTTSPSHVGVILKFPAKMGLFYPSIKSVKKWVQMTAEARKAPSPASITNLTSGRYLATFKTDADAHTFVSQVVGMCACAKEAGTHVCVSRPMCETHTFVISGGKGGKGRCVEVRVIDTREALGVLCGRI